MLDVVMVGTFILLVASMASLASWSDKVVKEGSNHDDCLSVIVEQLQCI